MTEPMSFEPVAPSLRGLWWCPRCQTIRAENLTELHDGVMCDQICGYDLEPGPSCATCRHWTEDPEARDSHMRWPDLYPTTTGDCSQAGQYAWATGYDVDESGLSTPPDFGCTLYEETP